MIFTHDKIMTILHCDILRYCLLVPFRTFDQQQLPLVAYSRHKREYTCFVLILPPDVAKKDTPLQEDCLNLPRENSY